MTLSVLDFCSDLKSCVFYTQLQMCSVSWNQINKLIISLCSGPLFFSDECVILSAEYSKLNCSVIFDTEAICQEEVMNMHEYVRGHTHTAKWKKVNREN